MTYTARAEASQIVKSKPLFVDLHRLMFMDINEQVLY